MKLQIAPIVILSSLLVHSGCAPGNQTVEPVASPAAVVTPAMTQTPNSFEQVTKIVDPATLVPIFQVDVDELDELPEGIEKVPDQKDRADRALAFSGEKTKLELPWDINPDVHPELTITCWVRFTGDADSVARAQVFSHDNGGYDRSIGLDSRSGEWGWSAFAGEAKVIGGVPVSAGKWEFLAVTYDEPSGRSRLTVGDTIAPVDESHLGSGYPYIWLGGNPGFGEYFKGEIANVRVFDRVLDDDELEAVSEL